MEAPMYSENYYCSKQEKNIVPKKDVGMDV